MAELHKSTVTELPIGLHTNSSPVSQPKGTHRFALNAVNTTTNGRTFKLSNENGNISYPIPEGFIFLGDRYMQDGNVAVILHNPSTKRDQIGIVDRNHKYTAIVDTSVLGLREDKQCDIIHRIRRGKEKVIYWVDAFNFARNFNFDRSYDFYNDAYKNYLRAGNDPNTYAFEKWDSSSFDLIKTYTQIPNFSNVEVLETGSILPGSYNFAIQLVDEDLNPTEWINVSDVVNIYNDSVNNTFSRIRGSKNANNSAQSFPRASKSIKLTITNLDRSFPYFRIAIIRASAVTGVPDKVLISDINPTTDSNYIYSGNDANLIEGSLEEILIENEVIFAPHHIEQLENRCILANVSGSTINWCEFQKYASKIKADFVTKEVVLNNILSEPNIKNPKSTFFYSGYMPGETYALNINFVMKGGYISPGFHIPGKSATDLTSQMGVYEAGYKYLDVHNCSTDNFWGRDYEGNTLVGKPVRHHKFPFRKDVNKPLYTKNTTPTTINKNRLKLVITLNPDWTPGPPSFPESGGDPLVIPFTVKYKVDSSPTEEAFNSQITDIDLGREIIIYDDITPLSFVTGSVYLELDPTSALASYQDGVNDRFILTEEYETYAIDSSIDSDISEIFGIELSNIEKPHPDVIGFYITRAERTDDDRTIIDNAIFGIMPKFDQYVSFGHLMPKQFYEATNCGFTANAGKTLEFYDKGVWFFSPEHQFLNKKFEFERVEIEGIYNETSVDMPSISNVENRECNTGYSKGIYINDVQAGTSYNPDINKKKDKDDDGFDLLIGYKNTNVEFNLSNNTTLPAKKRIYYHNAVSYQNLDSTTFYNVSVDNKIGMYLSDDLVDLTKLRNDGTNENSLLYGSLVRSNANLYSNFQTRTYYKEHNNPIMFEANTVINGVSLFNGDAFISAISPVSSVYYDMVVADRAKKSKVWKIIVGAVLVVVGVVVGIFTAGAGLTISALGIAALAALAVSYGVSLAMSGIKFEQFKAMVDVDYSKGLKETVVDGAIFETIRDTIEKDDDTIRWFSDRVSNVYMESNVPIGLRSGLTTGVSDFIDSPGPYDEEGFRTYLTEKLTVIDRDQGSGRLYKGYTTAEFYDINPDYMRFNKQKLFTPLPIEYNCCSDNNEVFPVRVFASEQAFQEELVDNYRVFLPNNYRDIEGEHGEITNLYRLGNNLFIHVEEAMYQLPQNVQERVTNEIVSFIGTGSFFGIPPRKILDSDLGTGGSQHKWATLKTHIGVFFINEVEHKIYLHSDRPKDISSEDNYAWFQENLRSFLADQLYSLFNIEYTRYNNPASKSGTGYISVYDSVFKRVIFTKKDYLILESKIPELGITSTIPLAGDSFLFCLEDNNFYKGTVVLALDNQEYFANKSWTISYSLLNNKFISLHSYLPNYYVHSQDHFYSFVNNIPGLWRHNVRGLYNRMYGTLKPFIVEFIRVHGVNTLSFESIMLQTEARQFIGEDQLIKDYITFNKILVYNSTQSSGIKDLYVRDNDNTNYLFNQIKNNRGSIKIVKRGRNWLINDFRDYVTNKQVPIFLSDWQSVKDSYYIDKVVNESAIDLTKNWHELGTFQDNFIVIRLIFDNFDNINLTLDFSIETEQPSNL